MIVFSGLDETEAVLQYSNVALLVCLSSSVQYNDSHSQVGSVTLQLCDVELHLWEKMSRF